MNVKRTLIALAAVAPMLASVPAHAAQTYMKSSRLAYASTPPMPWQDQDPAVGIYRNARNELNNGNYKRAASLFEQIIARHPRSTYAPDAYYWGAFALNRAGNNERAEELLVLQKQRHPRAATSSDAASLLIRIRGEMAKSGDAGAAQNVAAAAGNAARSSCSKDPEMQAEALNAFLHMNSEQAIPLLKQILARRDACSVEMRRKAVFLVSQKRGADVEAILLSAARNDPDKEVREQGVFWLSQVGSDRALEYLEDILKTSTDRDIQDKAVFALSQHRSPRAGQVIRDYAANQSAPREIREKAVFWLGQKQGTDGFLKTLYANEKDQEIKEKIIFSLSQQRGNESYLMDIATSDRENIEMRKKALFWAAQSSRTSLAELAGLYDRMNNREMKEQLIFAYSQRREKEAVDRLMQIAKTEPDRELRKKAIFWLSQSKDPRVAEFLMGLINN
jgi:HEAT repeat protein